MVIPQLPLQLLLGQNSRRCRRRILFFIGCGVVQRVFLIFPLLRVPRNIAQKRGALFAELLAPAAGLQLCQPVLGSHVDGFGLTVQLRLAQIALQPGDGYYGKAQQHHQNGHCHQHFRQRKALLPAFDFSFRHVKKLPTARRIYGIISK